jgi:hypothetical protein
MQLRQCNIGVQPEVFEFWGSLSPEEREELTKIVKSRTEKKRTRELFGAPSLVDYLDAGVIVNILLQTARDTPKKLIDRKELCKTITNFLNVIPKATRQESAHGGQVKEFDEEDVCRQLVLALEIFPSQEDVKEFADRANKSVDSRLFWFNNGYISTESFHWELLYGPLEPLTEDQKSAVKIVSPLVYRCKQFTSWKAILHEWCKTAMYPELITPPRSMQRSALRQFYEDATKTRRSYALLEKKWACTDMDNLGFVDLRLWLVTDMGLAKEDTRLWIRTIHEEIERLDYEYKISDASKLSEEVMQRAMWEKEVYTDYEALGRHVAAFMLMRNMIDNGFYEQKSQNTLLERHELIALLESETCGRTAKDSEASFKFGTHWLYKELYGDVGSKEASRLIFPTDYEAGSFLQDHKQKYELSYRNRRQVYSISREDNRLWQPWYENWLELEYSSLEDWENTPTSEWSTRQSTWKKDMHVNFLEYISEIMESDD